MMQSQRATHGRAEAARRFALVATMQRALATGCRRGAVPAAIVVAGALSAAMPASAAVSSTTGAAQAVTAPPSVAVGTYESSSTIRVFSEAQVTLPARLSMWTIGPSGAMTTSSLAAGRCLQSHMVHYDGLGSASPTLSGTATFSENVVGVIPTNVQLPIVGRPLDQTDALFGASGTVYPAPGNTGRGVELLTVDALSLAPATPRTLRFTLGGDGFDEVRVLTACDTPPPDVPEVPMPVIMPIVAAGTFGGIHLLRRRRLATR